MTESRRLERQETAIAAALCVVSGSVDALGFLQTGVFAANMTGNTVLAAISLAQLDLMVALDRALTIVAFFAGAMIGRMLLNAAGRRAFVPVVVEALLLTLVAFVDVRQPSAVMLMAVAMGVQATAVTRFRGASVSTVVLTSTLARLAETTLDTATGHRRRETPRPATPASLLAATWAFYAIGAAAGALLLDWMSYPLLAPAALVLAVSALLLPSRGGRSESGAST